MTWFQWWKHIGVTFSQISRGPDVGSFWCKFGRSKMSSGTQTLSIFLLCPPYQGSCLHACFWWLPGGHCICLFLYEAGREDLSHQHLPLHIRRSKPAPGVPNRPWLPSHRPEPYHIAILNFKGSWTSEYVAWDWASCCLTAISFVHQKGGKKEYQLGNEEGLLQPCI